MSQEVDALLAEMPSVLNPEQVAALLQMHPKGVYRWLAQGTIPAYKIGGRWHILRDELRQTLLQGSNQTLAPKDASKE